MNAEDRARHYPEMPPALANETDEEYTDRLTGADGTGRVPFDHHRLRQCSLGYHEECSERGMSEDARTCACPCHYTLSTEDRKRALETAQRLIVLESQTYRHPPAGGGETFAVEIARLEEEMTRLFESDGLRMAQALVAAEGQSKALETVLKASGERREAAEGRIGELEEALNDIRDIGLYDDWDAHGVYAVTRAREALSENSGEEG